MHKIKKQWVTVSLALLITMGGLTAISFTTGDADNINNNKPKPFQNVKLYGNGTKSQYLFSRSNLTTPTTDVKYTQNIHFNAPRGTLGDIEAIIPHSDGNKVDGYNVYTMYGPDGSITNASDLEWGHFGTKNLSQYYPINDANSSNNISVSDNNRHIAPNNKYHSMPWGNYVLSGSIINNGGKLSHDIWNNPINQDANLAYFAGSNSIWLAYSNNGQQFQPYSDVPIIQENNYGISGDFRDPFVMRNPVNNDFVAYVAGGTHHEMFVLTSLDGINWQYKPNDNIYLAGSGVAEMPDIKLINNKPVMFMSCEPEWPNSYGYVYYIPGYYKSNGIFAPDTNAHILKLDNGLDYYAASFVNVNPSTLLSIGELQDWDYAPKGNTYHLGSFTLPRVIQYNNGKMNTVPINPGMISKESSRFINSNKKLNIYPSKQISLNFDRPVSSFNINMIRQDDSDNTVSFIYKNGKLTIHRNDSDLNNEQNIERTTNINTNTLSSIEFYLDNDSIEAYIPEIHKMFTWADYTSTRNADYQVLINVPVQANIYKFDLNKAPQLNNIDNITSEYSTEKANLNNKMNVLNGHVNDSVNYSESLLNGYFNDIQNVINDANNNIIQVNNYNGDARQQVFIALANNDMDIANTKLYQASLQLKNLDDIATPYIDASAADARIANYYKNSVANSVSKANQKAADNAAKAADQNIINQQKASVSNSVAAANRAKASQAAQIADTSIESSIASSYAKSADNSIAALYRNSENVVNQSRARSAINSADKSIDNSIAHSAAQAADQSIESSIANSYAKSTDNSIANSIAANKSASASLSNKNQSIANSAAKSADNSIANSYKDSVSNSISIANQSKASSAASSADRSIADSVSNSVSKANQNAANNAAESADNSIADYYKNSVSSSVSSANHSKANSAAQSADNSIKASIASSAAQSADQSIASSEAAKSAADKKSSVTPQPSTPNIIPVIPSDNTNPSINTMPSVISSSSASNIGSSSANNGFGSSNYVATNNTQNHKVSHRRSKPKINDQIPLIGLAKHAYFYIPRHRALTFTNWMKRHADILQSVVKSNHSVDYKVKVGKRIGYVYGHLKHLIKPTFIDSKKMVFLHVGKRTFKLNCKQFHHLRINSSVRYGGVNHIKYYVNYGRKYGVIYDSIPQVKKMAISKVSNRYYTLMPKRYHYVKMLKPLMIYSNKHFTRRDHSGDMGKGITIRVKRLVRDGNMTRFELMNGRYITGLKSYVKLIK